MTLGVVGAGTMGAGIAQLGCQAGERTLLLDADAGALARARERIAKRLDAEQLALLELVGSTHDLAGCDVVVEAVPEDLALKQRVFTEVAEVAGPECVLATNTSSIPVTAVAAGVPGPERVVGMHFFNPAPVMRLVEVIAGVDSADWAVERVRALGEAMGRHVIDAADGPGFLVNRCNRPFGREALRCLQERIADVETIDRIVRMGGGFRMGPFELMDLVGVDVGFEVAKSFYALSFGEPRWRPSPLQARMAASGRHGRKTGRGWYSYEDGPHRPDDPPPPSGERGAAGRGSEGSGADATLVVIAGRSPLADELFEAALAAGFDARAPDDVEGEVPWLAIDCGRDDEDPPLEGAPQLVLCDGGSLAALDGDGPSVGFHALPPLAASALVELTRGPYSSAAAGERAEAFFATLGKHTAWVGDAPGLVLGRIVCQIVNEAAFALGEGVGSAADIDSGMVLGMNHPRGPLAWADLIGLEHVAAVLSALRAETGEERYRPAPELRRRVALGLTFHEDRTLY
ncbi:MAG TPA: 3-hydroxyacyl-CoA dehydrogenase NAD-binding domain-containing protein [Solirubrobacteraceae bacterium]|nr:3-hydroxyacyl-CoA dehydrogenase NAD-binding domain-containing protein [Solirubrobacteraceae bacterium]